VAVAFPTKPNNFKGLRIIWVVLAEQLNLVAAFTKQGLL